MKVVEAAFGLGAHPLQAWVVSRPQEIGPDGI
jgi:hypothetical protein